MFETIRPKIVLDALKDLIETELYIKESIKIDDNWARNKKPIENFIVDIEENNIKSDDHLDLENLSTIHEVLDNENPGGCETLIFDNNELIGIN